MRTDLRLTLILYTLKSKIVRTENVPKETSDDESTNILGTKYLRKRSMSDSNIALQDDSNVRNMVSKISYGKHRASKSFDELTFNRVFPTHEFAYVTAVREETDTNDLKINPSVITCDSVGTRATNLVDSTENKLNESIVANEKDTFNISSNNLISTDVDTSIIKLTNQMKKKLSSSKIRF